jgi:hypothetical protein
MISGITTIVEHLLYVGELLVKPIVPLVLNREIIDSGEVPVLLLLLAYRGNIVNFLILSRQGTDCRLAFKSVGPETDCSYVPCRKRYGILFLVPQG